ncbi:MAG: hypothetical protein R3F17_05800 [Planctomycetota bacterium]
MDIVPLANRHRVALERYLQDFAQRGESELANFCRRPEVSHEAFVLRLAAHEAGDVPEGRVPSCMRFLEANGHLLGRYTLRFHLTPELEKKGGHIGYSVRPGARRRDMRPAS